MRIYLMRFDSRQALNRAFGLLMDADAVESSVAGPEALELRFTVKRSDAESLILGIYLQGGLTWCSAHQAQAQGRVPTGH